MSKKNKTAWMTWQYKVLIPVFLILGLFIFAIAYNGMRTFTGLGELNEPILYLFSTHRDPTMNSIMKFITSIASSTSFLVVGSLGALFWVYKKREAWRPLLIIISLGMSVSISTLIKLITHNDRPLITDMVPPLELDYSFPSGHTLGTFVILLVTGYLFYSRYCAKDRNFWLITFLISSFK
jgi:membrane-associated phospholipid phosphatase